MRFEPEQPYNHLPLLPPNIDLETPAILKKAIKANRALAELKGIARTIPNPAIFINTLTIQEAKASSEIENILTTNDKIYQAFSAGSGQIDSATKEVLSYRTALWEGYTELLRRPVLTTNLFVRIVQSIKENSAEIRNAPGTQIRNVTTNKTIYTPPEGENIIRDKLNNLEWYIHEDDDIDPLIKMAIIHYQFEAIHPFFDGNGRAGRIINILYLIYQELLDLPILYLSRYIIQNKRKYYELLIRVTSQEDWQSWILYMLDAVEQTAISTTKKTLAIKEMLEQTSTFAKNNLPQRVYSKELIELLFHQPYCKAQFLVEANIAQRQTAADYLKQLEKIGLLKSQKVGRETLYLNQKLFELLSL